MEVLAEPPFEPGFRFGWFDAVIIVVGLMFALAQSTSFDILMRIYSPIPELAVGLAMFLPVFAFFLFCNVFRVSRPLELGWAALYVALMTATIRYEVLDWRVALAVSSAAMAMVIYLQTRKSSYHGVGWRWINPELPTWWEEHMADSP